MFSKKFKVYIFLKYDYYRKDAVIAEFGMQIYPVLMYQYGGWSTKFVCLMMHDCMDKMDFTFRIFLKPNASICKRNSTNADKLPILQV